MTTITIDRAVVKQVLDALDDAMQMLLPKAQSDKARRAAYALRAALAQQAEPLNLSDPAVQKRLASQWGYVPASAQAEPVEPVAWLAPRTVDSYSRPDLGYETCSKSDYGAFPAYTAPPQRTMVPLTEEEIVEAVREADLDWQAGWTLDEHAPNRFDALARAVEQASWEKNHGKA